MYNIVNLFYNSSFLNGFEENEHSHNDNEEHLGTKSVSSIYEPLRSIPAKAFVHLKENTAIQLRGPKDTSFDKMINNNISGLYLSYKFILNPLKRLAETLRLRWSNLTHPLQYPL